MRKYLEYLNILDKKLEETSYIVKGIDGKPFFGALTLLFSDGKRVHVKSKHDFQGVQIEDSIKAKAS